MMTTAQWSGHEASEAPHPNTLLDRASNKHLVGPHSNSKPNLQSCQFCRKRKIKCDKLEGGCSQCLRAQTDCIYPVSQRKGRPRKAGTNQPAPAPTPREAQLLKKILKLERTITAMSGKSDLGASPGEIDGLDSTDGDEISREQLGRLVIGKPYVNDVFWSNQLMDVLENSDDDSNEEEEEDSPEPHTSSDVFPTHYLFSANQPTINLAAYHPPPSQALLYWKLYIENCECLLKILHVPTIGKVIEEAQVDLDGLSKGNEALLFAIYYATVISLNSDETFTNFGTDREILLLRYESAVQSALVNAGLLNTQDITVLQAFLLYLICTRLYDGAAVWSMTGLAIRLAQGMGIDRDGELFKLNSVEVELRRRIWHQLSLLDLRSSEARGAYPMYLIYDTKLPLNINDLDISLDTKTTPVPRVGLTDMTVALLRLEVCEMTRRLHKSTSVVEKEKVIEEFEQYMETTYIQYCINAGPLYRLCANLGRLVVKRMVLMIFRRELNLPQSTREKLFFISIDIIDISNQLRKDEYARKWGWLVKTYMQWHAMAAVLSELSEQPRTIGTERAWKVIEETGPDWEVPEDRASRILYQSVKKLLIKARAHRASQEDSARVYVKTDPEEKHLLEDALYTTQVPVESIIGNHAHSQTIFAGALEHGIQQFYVPHHLSQDEMTQQDHGQTWFFDHNVQPLQPDQDLVFNAEYWSGWDPVKDYSLHGGTI